mgnify:CR=1 FL=1
MTQTFSKLFRVPISRNDSKYITQNNLTLKVSTDLIYPWEAFERFKDFDKKAMIIRHSIRGDDASSTGPLIDIGFIAAENLGKKFNYLGYGNKPFKFYSTGVIRCNQTCQYFSKGLNGRTIPSIYLDNTISGGYFNIEMNLGWPDFTNKVQTQAVKNKAQQWKEEIINKLPDGNSLWVSHDSLIVPLIYNLFDFDFNALKNIYRFNENPWTSPMTGIFIGVKSDEDIVVLQAIQSLEDGFISSDDYSHDYTYSANNLGRNFKSEVATNYSHPVYKNSTSRKIKEDLNYIFDKGNTNSNPLYCNNNYEGCESCVGCTTCFSQCNAECFNGCVTCDSCYTCNSCQTGCQTSGYGYVGNISNGKEVPLSRESVYCDPRYSESGYGCPSIFSTGVSCSCVRYISGGGYSCGFSSCQSCTNIVSINYLQVYKCGKQCMQCNASLFGCKDCYTGEYVKGGR